MRRSRFTKERITAIQWADEAGSKIEDGRLAGSMGPSFECAARRECQDAIGVLWMNVIGRSSD
jgi:hypothetical protein